MKQSESQGRNRNFWLMFQHKTGEERLQPEPFCALANRLVRCRKRTEHGLSLHDDIPSAILFKECR